MIAARNGARHETMDDGDAPGRIQALRLDPDDDVATALAPLARGQRPRIGSPKGGGEIGPPLAGDVARGHKFALRAVEEGAPVKKYGAPIGLATRAIAPGEHVHLHNLEGLAGRSARRRAAP